MFKQTCSLHRGEKFDFWVRKSKFKKSKPCKTVTRIKRVRL